MNIVPNILDNFSDRKKQEQVQKKQHEFHFIGDVKRIKGHILFSYNTVTKEIKQAVIERTVEIGIDFQPIYKNKVCVEKDCIYVQALNEKNAIKKINKLVKED